VRKQARRLAPALAVSVVAHGLGLGVALYALRPLLPAPARVIPVSLIEGWGGGAGEGPSAGEPPPAATPAPAVARPPASPPKLRRPAARADSRPAPPAAAGAEPTGGTPETGGVESGEGGGGRGGGDGPGAGVAGAAYGANPLPPYPLVARRLGMQGMVELDVLVAPDGHAVDVRIRRSSGFAPLDEVAVKTVRERWRFVPARQGTQPIESRVTVPIVFRLDGVETREPRG